MLMRILASGLVEELDPLLFKTSVGSHLDLLRNYWKDEYSTPALQHSTRNSSV
jgi:hypothetical protein